MRAGKRMKVRRTFVGKDICPNLKKISEHTHNFLKLPLTRSEADFTPQEPTQTSLTFLKPEKTGCI